MGSGGLLPTILPSASTGDSFTVIPGLESQVTSPLLLVRGDAYDGRYGGLLGELPRGLPGGMLEDPRSRSLGGGRSGTLKMLMGSKTLGILSPRQGGTQRITAGTTHGVSTCIRSGGGLPSMAPTILGPRYGGGVEIRAPASIRSSSSIVNPQSLRLTSTSYVDSYLVR